MGTWNRLSIAGQSAELFETATDVRPQAAVLFLHDVDLKTPAQDPELRTALERGGLPVVAPQGGRCGWLDRICSEFDPEVTPMHWLRGHLPAEMTKRWEISPPSIAVCGIGMGGQAALQLAYRFPRQFPVAAAVSPTVDFHEQHGNGSLLDMMFATKEAARQETATLHVHPLNWPPHQWFACDPADALCFEGCERLASKLASTGIPFESDLETSCQGRAREYVHLMIPRAIDFLVARLKAAPRGA